MVSGIDYPLIIAYDYSDILCSYRKRLVIIIQVVIIVIIISLIEIHHDNEFSIIEIGVVLDLDYVDRFWLFCNCQSGVELVTDALPVHIRILWGEFEVKDIIFEFDINVAFIQCLKLEPQGVGSNLNVPFVYLFNG